MSTDVVFHVLPKENIDYYVDTYKPYDKAGAYAIQEWIGYTGIREIRGSYYNVMGLPVAKLYRELEESIKLCCPAIFSHILSDTCPPLP